MTSLYMRRIVQLQYTYWDEKIDIAFMLVWQSTESSQLAGNVWKQGKKVSLAFCQEIVT